MNLPVLCPALSQLLHADCCHNSQHSRFECRTALVDRDVGCDAHLGDKIQVFLVAIDTLAMQLLSLIRRIILTIHCTSESASRRTASDTPVLHGTLQPLNIVLAKIESASRGH
jgi:hypothetical protein